MLIKRAYATICGIPNSRRLFLEPSVLLHLKVVSSSFMDTRDFLADGDGNKGFGEPVGFVRYVLQLIGSYNHCI